MKFYLWSPLHIFMIISPFVFAYILHVLSKHKTIEEKRLIGVKLSVVAVLILVARNIELFMIKDYQFDIELVPYQVCHIANFILLYAYLKKSDLAFGIAFLFNMIFAFCSLVFANGLANYSSIINVRGQAYIWGHMMIVILSLYAYLEGFVKVTWRKLFKINIIFTVLFLLSVLINNLFRIFGEEASNYYYTHHPERGTPLEIIWDLGEVKTIGVFEVNIIYVLLLGLFGLLIVFSMYLVTIEWPKKIKTKTQETVEN